MNELESVGIEERKTVDVSFWNIDTDVAQSVKEIMRNYSGRSGQLALKEMVFRYHVRVTTQEPPNVPVPFVRVV